MGIKELKGTMKLIYYKEFTSPTLDEQNYFFLLLSAKKKMNIAKIRTNSHEIWSDTGHWSIPKTTWGEIIFLLCDTK